jgi:hypothetical protein
MYRSRHVSPCTNYPEIQLSKRAVDKINYVSVGSAATNVMVEHLHLLHGQVRENERI